MSNTENIQEDINSNIKIAEENGMNLEGNPSNFLIYIVMRWGMVRTDNKQPVINCRFEDCFKTQMFRSLLKDFRCIITINGYYEWKVNGKDKQPFYLYPKEGKYLQLAGFFRPQRVADGSYVNSFVICTLEAMDNLTFIHHRMPVILTPELQKIWLDPSIDFKAVYRKIYQEKPKDMLSYYKVANVVNKIKNNNEDCIMELEKYKEKLHNRGMGRFFKYANKNKEAEMKESKEEKKETVETQGVQSTMPNTIPDSVTEVKEGLETVQLKNDKIVKPSENRELEDKGVPLRLHKGKIMKKNK